MSDWNGNPWTFAAVDAARCAENPLLFLESDLELLGFAHLMLVYRRVTSAKTHILDFV